MAEREWMVGEFTITICRRRRLPTAGGVGYAHSEKARPIITMRAYVSGSQRGDRKLSTGLGNFPC